MCPVIPSALHCVSATVEVRVAGTVELAVFTDALAKLRKATTGCVTSVSHSARMEQLGFPLDGFSRNSICDIFFENMSRKF